MRTNFVWLPWITLTLLCAILEAGPPQFWRIETSPDFLHGETEAVSVDSRGYLELGESVRLLAEPDAARLWSVISDGHALFVGSGDEGRIHRIQAGQTSTLFDSSELEIYAVSAGRDGRIYAGSAPDGKVYVVDREGKADVFYDPEDRYIWALCLDPQNRLWIATGLPGRLHRVDQNGVGQVVFVAPATHVTSLACAGDSAVYAGTAPDGVVYRLDKTERMSVLHDSGYEEIKALWPDREGNLFIAAVQQSQKEAAAVQPAVQPAPPPGATTGEQVIVSETFTLAAPVPAMTPAAPIVPAGAPVLKGAVLKIDAAGNVDTLWRSTEETPQALVAFEDGLLVGTGGKGRLYRVRNDRTWSMEARLPAEHITGLYSEIDGRRLIVITSNPSKVYALERDSVEEGTFVSAVKDVQAPSLWGHIAWDAAVPAGTSIAVSTRSGNTAAPDGTWSTWSSPYVRSEGEKVVSPAGRFIQARVKMRGSSSSRPRLSGLRIAFLQRNLRPELSALEVLPPGEVFQKTPVMTGDIEILGLDDSRSVEPAPSAGLPAVLTQSMAFSRRFIRRGLRTFTWQASDPNGDVLEYDIEYRPVDGTRYRPLRQGLIETVWTWDTTAVPNGRYVLRVVAHDRRSNPEALSLSAEMESAPFDVDNTPPQIKAIVAQRPQNRIRVVVRDDDSMLQKAEYAVNGGEWREIYPTDGINDEREETYDFAPVGLAQDAPDVIIVRVADLLGNSSSARVDLPNQ